MLKKFLDVLGTDKERNKLDKEKKMAKVKQLKKKKSILIGKHMIKIEKKIAEGGYADIYRVIADEDDNVHIKQSLNPISALGARKHTISVYDVPLDVYALKRMFFQANSAPKLLSEE